LKPQRFNMPASTGRSDLDSTVDNPHRKRRHIFIRRRAFDGAGFHAKSGAVTRTDEFIAVEFAAGDFGAVMRADIFYRITLTINFKYRDIGTIDINDHVLPICQRCFRHHIYPIRHASLALI